MVELAENLFQVIFETEDEMHAVIDGGPWMFDNFLVLFKQWEKGMHKGNVIFDEAHFWVQVWNLPMAYRTAGVAKAVGGRIGTFLGWDDTSLMDTECSFIRIRVIIPVETTLMRGVWLPIQLGERVWLDYKYECLPVSCDYCGILGHDDKCCALKNRDVVNGKVKGNQYGPWLRGFRPKNTGNSNGFMKANTEEKRDEVLQRAGGGDGGGGEGRITPGSVTVGEHVPLVGENSNLVQIIPNLRNRDVESAYRITQGSSEGRNIRENSKSMVVAEKERVERKDRASFELDLTNDKGGNSGVEQMDTSEVSMIIGPCLEPKELGENGEMGLSRRVEIIGPKSERLVVVGNTDGKSNVQPFVFNEGSPRRRLSGIKVQARKMASTGQKQSEDGIKNKAEKTLGVEIGKKRQNSEKGEGEFLATTQGDAKKGCNYERVEEADPNRPLSDR